MAAHDSAATPSEGITSTPGAGAPAYPTPADSTAIQPDSDRILLPPPPLAKPSGMSPERLAAWATRMDVLLGGLAFLAISTRLLIQPATASLLFLGLTFFLLHYRNEEYDVAETSRSERRRSIRAGRPTRHLWALPALFAVWANVDAWFLLGPAL